MTDEALTHVPIASTGTSTETGTVPLAATRHLPDGLLVLIVEIGRAHV